MKLPKGIIRIFPEGEKVPLNSIIEVELEESNQKPIKIEIFHLKQTVNLSQFPPIDKSQPEIVSGRLEIFSPKKERRSLLRFHPHQLFGTNLEHTVILQVGTDISFKWRFCTESGVSSLRLQVKMNSGKPRLVSIVRETLGMFNELKAKIAARFDVNPQSIHHIFKIVQSSNNSDFPIEICGDRDVYLLKQNDLISFEIGNIKELEKDPNFPHYSFEEYCKIHPVPEWAGYFVVGDDKMSSDQVEEIVSALIRQYDFL